MVAAKFKDWGTPYKSIQNTRSLKQDLNMEHSEKERSRSANHEYVM